MKKIANGGVVRQNEYGRLESSGVPPLTDARALSLTGWGGRDTLSTAGLGKAGTDTPQLWLCTDTPTFAPVWSRLTATGTETRLIRRNGNTVGICYEDAHAEYCLLTGVLPPDLTASRPDQTTAVFEGIEDALKDAGMTFDNVARTWLYMDKILEWYDPFNRARDAFFRSRGVYDKLVPASTGIGSANLIGSAITACAIALKPKHGAVTVEAIPSPLQCAALQYGSSFSRAVEIGTPDYRTLLISGTASIEPGGATAYVDDVEKQIQLTMDVVEAILDSRGMGWADTTRAVMYLKKPDYMKPWQDWLQARNLTAMPLITIEADVCRDDLLVELELDAVIATA
ncbi:MAG: hypothetical protein FWG50_11270 [Kiritimatiellaeota bacterium]|nr:hypothetical protein [Kiritimatiellota bacterium]